MALIEALRTKQVTVVKPGEAQLSSKADYENAGWIEVTSKLAPCLYPVPLCNSMTQISDGQEIIRFSTRPTDDASEMRRQSRDEVLRAGKAFGISPAGNPEISDDTRDEETEGYGQLRIDVPSVTCLVGTY